MNKPLHQPSLPLNDTERTNTDISKIDHQDAPLFSLPLEILSALIIGRLNQRDLNAVYYVCRGLRQRSLRYFITLNNCFPDHTYSTGLSYQVINHARNNDDSITCVEQTREENIVFGYLDGSIKVFSMQKNYKKPLTLSLLFTLKEANNVRINRIRRLNKIFINLFR